MTYADEHTTVVDAPDHLVWDGLLEALDRALSGGAAEAYARLVGCADTSTGGPRPLTVGSTLPGFHVTSATPARELVLAGRHRFSSYTLAWRLEALEGATTRVTAATRADFTGLGGRAYRAAVIGTGAHDLGVRRLLDAVRRTAEHRC